MQYLATADDGANLSRDIDTRLPRGKCTTISQDASRERVERKDAPRILSEDSHKVLFAMKSEPAIS